MTAATTRNQIRLARLAAALCIALLAMGLIWYGLSTDVIGRFSRDLFDRPGGPLSFRFMLQPVMAGLAALYDGLKDARTGRSPYFWTILHDRAERSGRLREGLIATARIILLGLGMDVIYQLTVLGTFYPGEAAVIALLLAFVPYLLLRGPIARIARWWNARSLPNHGG